MSLLRQSLELAQRFVPVAHEGACVLAYHLVEGRTEAVVDVPLDEFRRQLDFLREHCEVVTLEDALERPSGSKRRVVLTFDDAYRNFRECAWPELTLRGLPATLYVPIGFVEGSSGPPLTGAALPALSFAELRELQCEGLSIGSHSVSHRNLRRLPLATVTRELSESRQRLEQELACPVRSFCYPQAKLSARIARLAAQHYQSAVTAGGSPYLRGSKLAVPRYPVRRGEARFESMVGSALWLPEAVAHSVRQFRA